MHKIRAFIVYLLSNTVGELLVVLRPGRAKELMKEGITVVIGNDGITVWERLMRRSILKRVEKRNDPNELSELYQSYWKNKGSDFFELNNRRLEVKTFEFIHH